MTQSSTVTERLDIGGLKSALARLDTFVLVVDENARIVFVNRGGPGGSPDEVQGTSALDHLAPEHHHLFADAFARARETSSEQQYRVTSYGAEYEVRVVPMLTEGTFNGATLLATEVSPAAPALEPSPVSARTASLDAVIAAASDIMFRFDRRGIFLEVRASNLDELFVPADKIVGASVHDLMPAEIAEQCMQHVEAVLETGLPQIWAYQLPIGGGLKDYEARFAAIGKDQVVAIIRNTTELKRIAAEYATTGRLAAVGSLVAGVSHEINNPLTYVLFDIDYVVRALSAAMPESSPMAETGRVLIEHLERAKSGAERVARVVRDLQAFAPADPNDRRPVDCRVLLDGAIKMVAHQIRMRGQLSKDYQGAPIVRGHAGRLGQAFLSVLINAIEALPADTEGQNLIDVRARVDADNQVVIEIRDTGGGVDPAIADHVFEPFTTSKPAGAGAGLGLWLTHSVVVQHGGEVAIESSSEGTTVRITLPGTGSASALPAVLRDAAD